MRDQVQMDDAPLSIAEVIRIADGAELVLSDLAWGRITAAAELVGVVSTRGLIGYGINTGVGAFCDVVISPANQSALSRNLLFSHACGVGEPLSIRQSRAVMAVQIGNYAKGLSGIRPETVRVLLALLNGNAIPVMPERGSVGYLTHAAAMALVLIGEGEAFVCGQRVTGRTALEAVGCEARTLAAKEGLSLINGTPCATGLACLAVTDLERLLDWSDSVAAFTYDILGGKSRGFGAESMILRQSPGLQGTARRMQFLLEGRDGISEISRTQDPLSLRAIPHVHGAVRDSLAAIRVTVERELASATDNPLVTGSKEQPVVMSQAHAVASALALAMDQLAIAAAQLGGLIERRIDGLVNPLISGLPPFLSVDRGICSGYMIAQYTAAALVGENRRLAAPASLDGGITSALQEDFLSQATPAAEKAARVLENLEILIAIELLCAAQAYDLSDRGKRSDHSTRLHDAVRSQVSLYRDNRQMSDDFAVVRTFMRASDPFAGAAL